MIPSGTDGRRVFSVQAAADQQACVGHDSASGGMLRLELGSGASGRCRGRWRRIRTFLGHAGRRCAALRAQPQGLLSAVLRQDPVGVSVRTLL